MVKISQLTKYRTYEGVRHKTINLQIVSNLFPDVLQMNRRNNGRQGDSQREM